VFAPIAARHGTSWRNRQMLKTVDSSKNVKLDHHRLLSVILVVYTHSLLQNFTTQYFSIVLSVNSMLVKAEAM
jgi:hypothetical protein